MSSPAEGPRADPAAVDLSRVEAAVRTDLDAKFEARERALRGCRRIIQSSSKAIRALHRGEDDDALDHIAAARAVMSEIEPALLDHTDIYHAGFFSDAVKEYAEAELTAALLGGDPLPLPGDLGVGSVPYLNGMGEAVGELRRALLDQLRRGMLTEAEDTFGTMERVLDLLAALDYPDGMTGGLRRTTDVARALIERSRSDLTLTIVQERVRSALGAPGAGAPPEPG